MKIRINIDNTKNMKRFQNEMIEAMENLKTSLLKSKKENVIITKSLFSDRITMVSSDIHEFDSKYTIRQNDNRKLFDAIVDCSQNIDDIILFFATGSDNDSSACFEQARQAMKRINMRCYKSILISFGSSSVIKVGQALGFNQIIYTDMRKDVLPLILVNNLMLMIK